MRADQPTTRNERYFMQRILGLFCLVAVLAGCDHGERELRWKEDVLLQDGRVITLDRVAKYEGSRELTQKNYGLSWYAVDFEHPVTREKIHWESQVSISSDVIVKALRERWEVPPDLNIMALMIKSNDIYLVTDSNRSTYEDVCAYPLYMLYKWESNRWKRMKLEDIPYRKFAANVLYDLNGSRDVIKANRYNVKVEITSNQTLNYVPSIIDLTGMTKQTFTAENCNWLSRDWTEKEHLSN